VNSKRLKSTVTALTISLSMSLLLYSDLNYKIELAIGTFAIALILSFFYDRNLKNKLQRETEILIQQDYSSTKEKLKKIETPYLILLILTIATLFLAGFNLNAKFIIIGIIPLFILNLITRNYGDFYITKEGFEQPEYNKKNYKWSEIDNLIINDTELMFTLDRKDYHIPITREQSTSIRNLKNTATLKKIEKLKLRPEYNNEVFSKKSIEIIIVSFLFLTAGFALLHYDLIGYGVSFFVFMPFVLGFIYGSKKNKPLHLVAILFVLIIFSLLLYQSELEGMVCLLMAMPIVLFFVAIGYFVKRGIQKLNHKKPTDENTLKSTVLPIVLVFLAGFTEKTFTDSTPKIIEVKTEITLPYSPMEVYDAIKNVDTLDAEKPFLMHLDLPIPQKCILEEEKVGALRTCYFEGGKIVERVTELEKGKILKMDVIDYQLTGRKWLGFKEAIYTFEELPNGHCKMARITTYTSELYPRLYWEPLERIGIEQEHQYVFNNLIKDLK
jgi:hypothetical protein